MARCAPNKMTADEKRITLAYFRAGMSYNEIGRRRGISSWAVRKRLECWGVELEPRARGQRRKAVFPFVAARANGLTFEDIGRAYGVSKVAVWKRLEQACVPNTYGFFRRLKPAQREAYRAALDDDLLPHADALEIALEYEENPTSDMGRLPDGDRAARRREVQGHDARRRCPG